MLMAEFDTACRYQLPIKVFICNNGCLGQILLEQLVLGFPEYGVRFEGYADFAPWVQSCGEKGIKVEKASQVDQAVADGRES